MAIYHKFKEFDWRNGFSTKDTILRPPYNPEIIFIGTFNHGWEWNMADFFYGRDMYMWPILANLFLYNSNYITTTRNHRSNNPTLSEIFRICKKGKITFADIVSGLDNEIPIQRHSQHILVNENFTWSNYSDKQLNSLGQKDYLIDNVTGIVDYINQNKSIRHVYFTFKSENWLLSKRDEIIRNISVDTAGSIFTPTGMGFRKNLLSFPNRCSTLSHCWIWNGMPHKVSVHKHDYINLNHDWLKSKGVDINVF